MSRVTLVAYRRRRALAGMLLFAGFCVLVLVVALVTLNGDSSGGRKVFAGVAIAAGAVGLALSLLLLVSSLVRDFAVIAANEHSIYFVAPIGLGWLNSSGSLEHTGVEVPRLRRVGDGSSRLTEFEIVVGDRRISASLDESSLEEDYLTKFDERSSSLGRTDHG